MNFDFSPEQKQLRDSTRRFLADKSTSKAVRAILETSESFDRDLWKSLGEMGYLGAAIPEEYGGLGGTHLELCVIAEELGRALAAVPVSSSIYLAAECLMAAGSEDQKQTYLPKLASGEWIGTLALSEGLGNPTPQSIKIAENSGTISGKKSPVMDGDIADFAIVAARTSPGTSDHGISLFLIDLKSAGVTRKTLDSIDPTRGLAEIDFNNASATLLGERGHGWAIVESVLNRAAVLTAFEQIGGSDRALEMACEYARERMAFGRPIGSFQAVKHMLADMYVSATLARSNCYYGAWALYTNAPELAEAAATARVSATQAFQHCSKNNIQTHGGMGYTWEFDCHLFYRRSNLLALSLGSQSHWEDLLIARMRARNAA